MDKQVEITEKSFISKPLADQMKIDVVMNDNGQLWLLHDKPFTDILNWAEYDTDLNDLTLVTQGGDAQSLGMKIPPKLEKKILKAENIYVIRVNEKQKKMEDFYILPLLKRDGLLH